MSNASARVRTWLEGLDPAARRLHVEAAEDLAQLAELGGFVEDAEVMRSFAREIAAGAEREEVDVEELQGSELVTWLLQRDERHAKWLSRQLQVSHVHAWAMANGSRVINEKRARQLADLWPEYGYQRFMTPAVLGERRRAG